MTCHGSSDDDEDLAPTLRLSQSQLSSAAFDEEVAHSHSESECADVPRPTTPHSDGKDDVASALSVPQRPPNTFNTSVEQGTEPQSAPAGGEPGQTTPANEDDLHLQLPAEIFHKQVGKLNQRRETRTAEEDSFASPLMVMSLLEVRTLPFFMAELMIENSARMMQEEPLTACGPHLPD